MDILSVKRLNEEEFQKFAKLIHDESGIFLKPTKITLLSNRLRKRLQDLNIDNFADYYKYIKNAVDRSREIEALLDVVSTNETFFFRNERHFNALLNGCLPEIARKKNEKTLRIWSAGCSTGEEPYTISICLNERLSLFPGWNIEILATDIAYSVLDFAKEGKYSGRRIEKVSPQHLKQYFSKVKDTENVYSVKEQVRRYVKFSQLNLFKDPFPKNVDILFCRNVMIYFDRNHQQQLVSAFSRSINKKDGYFFIGHSETLHSISDDFAYVKILDAPVYVPSERANDYKNN